MAGSSLSPAWGLAHAPSVRRQRRLDRQTLEHQCPPGLNPPAARPCRRLPVRSHKAEETVRKLLSTDLDGTIMLLRLFPGDLDAMARWRAAATSSVPDGRCPCPAHCVGRLSSDLRHSVLYTGAVLVAPTTARSGGLTPCPTAWPRRSSNLLQAGTASPSSPSARRRPSALQLARLRRVCSLFSRASCTDLLSRTHPRQRPPAHSRCGAPGAHSGRIGTC